MTIVAESRGLEKLKCCKCSRTIAKVTGGGVLLRAGVTVEIKCGSCNAFNYLIGADVEPKPTETDRNRPK